MSMDQWHRNILSFNASTGREPLVWSLNHRRDVVVGVGDTVVELVELEEAVEAVEAMEAVEAVASW